MDAQQEYFTALRAALVSEFGGDRVFDSFLPPDDTPLPFIYLAGSTQVGMAVKAQFAGYISQVVQNWNVPTQRGTVSDYNRRIREIARNIRQTEHYNFILQETETTQEILNDTTTRTPLMQGYTSLRVFFSRR